MADRRQTLRTDVVVDTGKAEGELKRLGKAADNAGVDVKSLAREMKQAEAPAKNLGREAKDTGSKVSNAMDDSADSAIGAASAMGEAFGQGGSATDALGSFSEVVESIAGSFGPIGGVVAFAGGAIIGMFAGAAKKAEELRDRTHEVFDALADGGGVLDEAFKKQTVQQFVKDNQDLVESVGSLLGSPGLKDLGEAISGNNAAYDRLNKTVEDRIDAMKTERKNLEALQLSGQNLTSTEQARLQQINEQLPKLEELNTKIDDQAGVIAEARHQQDLMNGVMGVAGSTMSAYTGAMTDNITETQRSYEWQLKQTTALYDAATAAKVAAQNVEWLNTAQKNRDQRGTAPTGNASYIEGKNGAPGYWVYNSGPNIGQRIPGLASGGPVQAGQAVRVGEYGSEVFVPNTDGTIVPHGASMGGAVTIHQTVVTNDPVRLARDTARALRRSTFRGG